MTIRLRILLLCSFLVGGVYGAPSLTDKIEGLLIGSAIGDAAGGPVEFVDPPERSVWSTRAEPVDEEAIRELGKLFRLRNYSKGVEPFAQWEAFGPAGTVTDDTRFKLIFFNALRQHGAELGQVEFARAVLDFRNTLSPAYQKHYDTWIPEIEYATRWAIGERDGVALPVDRIWGGIPTMEGQMPFLPIAALNPENPDWCYRKCYELGYFDIGVAKDINSALVAGLAAALQEGSDWSAAERAMREVDPYRYNETLYVRRELTYWLDVSHELVKRSEGNIARLFDLLESESKAYYWWEAWVPIVVVFSCAEIVDYDPMASMQLMMEFGHDTDSYAQVMGGIMGAIHGKDVFPKEMRETVNARMKEQFGQNVDDWMALVRKFRIR